MSQALALTSSHLGRYVLIQKIAVGGVADVYLAKTKTSTQRDKYLVLKCLRADAKDDVDFLETIINEAELSVRLRHPNIVEVFDLCEVDSRQFLAMEYLDANDLASVFNYHIRQDSYLDTGLALFVINEIAKGLHHAHELKDKEGKPIDLVHRDISSQNILLSSSGEIKISDFGIAKTNYMRERTPSGVIKGKFHYMSPEQAWGDKVDRRSDIFSLGIIMYEAIVGREAYPYNDIATLIEKARIALIPQPRQVRPEIPADLEAIILKALDIDKKERYQTAAEFADAVESYRLQHYPRANRKAWIAHLDQIQERGAKLPLLHASDYLRDIHSILPQQNHSSLAQSDDDFDITERYAIADVERAKNEKHIASYGSPSTEKQPSLLPYITVAVVLLITIIAIFVYFIL
ncbi:MAG: serine/threonine-protein kinase [Bradymonadales bacterium]|jgi:serine/threonine protein kinase